MWHIPDSALYWFHVWGKKIGRYPVIPHIVFYNILKLCLFRYLVSEVNTTKEEPAISNHNETGEIKKKWLDRWIERLFRGTNWDHLSHGCISYPSYY